MSKKKCVVINRAALPLIDRLWLGNQLLLAAMCQSPCHLAPFPEVPQKLQIMQGVGFFLCVGHLLEMRAGAWPDVFPLEQRPKTSKALVDRYVQNWLKAAGLSVS